MSKKISVNGAVVYAYEVADREEFVCEMTGEVLSAGDWYVDFKDGVVSADYVEANECEFWVCDDCDRLYHESDIWFETTNGRICEDCFFTYEYIVCEDCGRAVPRYDQVTVHTSDYHWYDHPFEVCEDCASERYHCCDSCGTWYTDGVDFYEAPNGEYYCPQCWDTECVECYDCGEILWRDEAVYVDGDFYCSDCAPRRSITSYHAHRYNRFDKYNLEGKVSPFDSKYTNDEYIGTELEVENGNVWGQELQDDASDVIEMMNDRVYCEEDCSLAEDSSFEIISQPHTYEAFKQQPWKEMLEHLRERGYTSHNNGRCGLHIHVSKQFFGKTDSEIEDNIAKVVHMYSANFEFFKLCSRRESTYWCEPDFVADFETAKLCKSKSNDHHKAINLGNLDTIGTVEFRLGRGTLIYGSYMAWVDIHVAIARNAKNIEPNNTDLNLWLNGISDETKIYILGKTGRMVA